MFGLHSTKFSARWNKFSCVQSICIIFQWRLYGEMSSHQLDIFIVPQLCERTCAQDLSRVCLLKNYCHKYAKWCVILWKNDNKHCTNHTDDHRYDAFSYSGHIHITKRHQILSPQLQPSFGMILWHFYCASIFHWMDLENCLHLFDDVRYSFVLFHNTLSQCARNEYGHERWEIIKKKKRRCRHKTNNHIRCA